VIVYDPTRINRMSTTNHWTLRALRRFYAAMPSADANNAILPMRSQTWDQVIHAAVADHLDVLGHFRGAVHDPPHVDWLVAGSGFDREDRRRGLPRGQRRGTGLESRAIARSSPDPK
jgi:hypothetical protein